MSEVPLPPIPYTGAGSAQSIQPILSSLLSLAGLGILGTLIALLLSTYPSLENLVFLSPYVHTKKGMGAHSKKDVADHRQLGRLYDVTSSAISVISAKPSTVFPLHGSRIERLQPRVHTYFFHCSNKVIDGYFQFFYSPSNSGTYVLFIC